MNTDECNECGTLMEWKECWNCEDGYAYHDCGEDTCCCLDPEPNVVCDVCNGEDGWMMCPNCRDKFLRIQGELVNDD